jgi:hypothetical protein
MPHLPDTVAIMITGDATRAGTRWYRAIRWSGGTVFAACTGGEIRPHGRVASDLPAHRRSGTPPEFPEGFGPISQWYRK